MSQETAFPRGGRAPKDDSTKKRHVDFLFGSQEAPEKRKKRRKSSTATLSPSTSLLPLGGGGVVQATQKRDAFIESLSFSKLAKGTKLLGVVREVHEDYAVVSLPNLLSGYILKRDKDPLDLTESLSVRQVLAVSIVKTAVETTKHATRKRIQVSALPASINSLQSAAGILRGRITSVEDHGCLVDLGHGRTGFLSFDDVEGEYSVDASDDSTTRRLNPGRLYDFAVKETKTPSKVLALHLPSVETLAKKMLSSQQGITLNSLNPGSLVKCRMEGMARNGLLVNFMGNFRGAIELSHLGGHWIPNTREASTEWKEIFESQKSLTARILAVDAQTKVVRLTLLPHLLHLQVPRESLLPSVGTVVENCPVVRLDPGVGALLALPVNKDLEEPKLDMSGALGQNEDYARATPITTAYVHISKACDGGRTSEADFNKQFAPSTKHTLRILSTNNWLEGIGTCATGPSMVQAHVLTHADLKQGQVYRNVPVCAQLQGGSVMVDFGMGIRGLIPQMHLFDHSVKSEFRNRLQKEKYAVGAKVDVKVLDVDVEEKKCLCTAKKSLVSAKDCIADYASVKPGQQATGYISKLDDRGLYVTFYNRVFGKVTAKSLAAELGVENHRADYHVGDVVKCRVINCRKRNNSRTERWDLNLSLSLTGDEEMEDGDESCESRRVQLHAGAILPEKSMRVVEITGSIAKKDGIIPGHAIVRIKAKHLIDDKAQVNLPHVECKLPFDQLMDSYSEADIESAESMDALAKGLLTVGNKIDQRGIVLSDPKKSSEEYSSGLGRLPVVSLRPKLIATAEASSSEEQNDYNSPLLPTDDTHLFMGAFVQGYVTQVNPKHGSFVRFLNRLTGLVPKVKKGLNLPKYGTVTCRIVALDVSTTPPRMLLNLASAKDKKASGSKDKPSQIKPGDVVDNAVVVDCDFFRAKVKILGDDYESGSAVRSRVHVTMAKSDCWSHEGRKPKLKKQAGQQQVTKYHPFYKWKKGTKLSQLTCVAVDVRDGVTFVELSNRDESRESEEPPLFINSIAELRPGTKVSAVITTVSKKNTGAWVQVSPGISGFVPALELSTDADALNDLSAHFPLGVRIECTVMDKEEWHKRKRLGSKAHDDDGDHGSKKGKKHDRDLVFLSALVGEGPPKFAKPSPGELVVGRIHRAIPQQRAPALMLDLRGGFTGRCCITELEEVDDWFNMPLGRTQDNVAAAGKDHHNIVTDEEEAMDVDDHDSLDKSHAETMRSRPDVYPDGKYVQCRVVASVPSKPLVEVSLRSSRLEGDLDDDQLPEEKEMVQGFVVATNKKGCFVRLSRQVEGRVILKELCDGFLQDPAVSFPMGRLVVGKVKAIQKQSADKKRKRSIKATVDLDMRESTLLESEEKLQFDDIELQSKHKGVVTRIESYGVFVRLDHSDVSGLAHKSECSDNYIKNLADLYDPGDLVKVLVIKKEDNKIGFSLKASHFEDDEDSEDESLSDESQVEEDSDEEMADGLVSDHEDDSGDELDSDDENFASKLASKIKASKEDDSGDSEHSDYESKSEDSSEDDSSDSDSDDDDDERVDKPAMDTNVGFDWGAGDSKVSKQDEDSSDDDSVDSSDEDDDDDSTDGPAKTGHKSRRKAAARRREEQEIARREAALADGTADDNPETAADFERLLASDPNRSEHWIRYMAYHLSLADIESARNIAQRAFDRIEFRQEGEKLNVWTALLTLELKYGSPEAFQETIDRACQHNNPKQVYLRACEMLEKQIDQTPSSSEAVSRADELHAKMCKKFRSKKTVWIKHLQYLLKGGRHQEAHGLLKRALTSLPEYKHIETMSKFAQLEMEHGSMERGRTIMDGLISKYPKRLDLLFVYVDKQIKHGELAAARSLFEQPHKKLSDKQMKSLFKKWYRMEEEHGTDESRQHVKDAARAYVEQSNK